MSERLSAVLSLFFILQIYYYAHTEGSHINTPSHISFEREWIISEDEPIGSVVAHISVSDDDGDNISIRIGEPSSKGFQTRHNAASFFVLDDHMRVKLVRSVKGMAGESFLVGIVSSDGHVLSRVDAKVIIRGLNERVRTLPRGLPSSFHPGPPPPLTELHKTFLNNGSGPPLLHLDPFTIWEIDSNATVGTIVAQIEAQDLSHSFLRFSLHSSKLLKIDEHTGIVTVARSLMNQVGDHKLKIEVSNQFSNILEELTLRVISNGDIKVKLDQTSSRNNSSEDFKLSLSRKIANNNSSKQIEIINRGTGLKDSSTNHKGYARNLTLMIVVFGIISAVVMILFLLWKYRHKILKPKLKLKENSIFCRTKDRDMKKCTRKDTILSGFFATAKFHKRAKSNKYEENRNLPHIPAREIKESLCLSPSPSLSKFDDWEIPRYKLRVLGILGEGCFGQVWKCETIDIFESGPRFVAVKTIKESAGDAERNDLLQELRVLKSLGHHPNVVSLIGSCTEKDPLFVVLEYMAGGKLQSYLRSSRAGHSYGNLHSVSDCLTPKDLIIYALQVAKGMVFLVQNGIIHRDLAARNILMGENKICKVADFGFARDITNNHVYERKSDGRLPIRWMATESLFDNVFTTKSDVWSFGVLLWEIVTLGSTPYPGMSASEVMRRVKAGYRLEKPHHCRREIYNIMYYCWASNPTDRQSFSELVDTLESMILTEVDYIHLDNFPEHHYYNFSSTSASGELL